MTGSRSIWFWVLVLVMASVVLHWPTFSRELWNLDEASTCVFAQHVAQGDVLYRDVVDTRSPFMVYFLAAVVAVGGDWNMPAQHLAVAVLLGLTAALLWRTAARLGAAGAGAWAAGVFTLVCIIFLEPCDAFSINTESFVNFFSALGFCCLAAAWRRARRGLAFLGGVSFSLSYLSKQPGLLDFGTAVIWVALFLAFDPADRRPRLQLLAALIAGFLAAGAGTLAYFAAHGAFQDYQFYVWTYSTRYYLPDVSALDRLIRLRMPFQLAWQNVPLLGIGAAAAVIALLVGLVRSFRSRLTGQELPLLALGWFASGVLGSGLSGREYGHYAIQVFPGLSLLCGWILHAGWEWARRWTGWRTGLVRAAIVAPLALPVWQTRQCLASVDLAPNPWSEIGAIVGGSTSPADRIFVWGYFPEIHVFARRLAASRFVFSNFLTGMIPWTNIAFDVDTTYAIIPGSWEQLWQDFERHPPAVIVDSQVNRCYAKYPLGREARLWVYVRAHYLEIEADRARPLGFRVYRRTGATLPAPADGAADRSLQLEEEMRGPLHTGVVHARLSGGLRAAELVVNGRATGTVTLAGTDVHQLTYTYDPALDGRGRAFAIRARRVDGAVATGPVLELDQAPAPLLPVLRIDHREVAALVADCPAGFFWNPAENVFSTHAPSRLVFERPGNVNSIALTFGLAPGAYAPEQSTPSDGIELQVNFQPAHGESSRLLTRLIDPRNVPADRGPQAVHVTLPDRAAGRIEVVVTPGPRSDPTCDWAFISNVDGSPTP